jgi:hypothetical protein
MKPHVRVLGIDDAPFRFGDERVEVVGVVVRAPNYIEGVMRTDVQVDGTDATDRLVEMLKRSRYSQGLALVMIDGAALGGFNVVDIQRVHEALGVPVATVTKKKPDLEAMVSVLRRRFPDAAQREALITRAGHLEVRTQHRPLHVNAVGIAPDELKGLIALTTVRGALPEPLRVAHLIATALRRGESHGRA